MEWGPRIIRIATYNVKNLFLHGEGEHHPDKPKQELRPLLRMVAHVNADVLALQEVGSPATLDAFNAGLAEPYAHLGCLPGNSDRSIHLAVLSRFPVQLTSHAAEPLPLPGVKLQRDLLRATCRMPGGPELALFVLHLKSQTSHSAQITQYNAEEIRRAEVGGVVNIVKRFKAASPETMIVLLGDFNDRPHSDVFAPFAELALTDPQGELLRRRGQNPSTYWPKRGARFDRILLCPNARNLLDPFSPTIHSGKMGRTASDHYPVSLVLR